MLEEQRTNMDLWVKSTFTDPKFTKTFRKPGGFSGTSINATYLLMRATEQFGPVGIGWGWSVVEDRYVDGNDLVSSDGVVLGKASVHVVRIKLWYMWNGQRGEIEHFGQTTFIGKDKNGIFVDEEHAKKSLTDAITKALSCIGFASGIHLGQWDDNKYVAAMEKEAQQREAAASGNGSRNVAADVPVMLEQPQMGQSEREKSVKEVLDDIDRQTTYDDIKKAFAKGAELAHRFSDKSLHEKFKKTAADRWTYLKSQASEKQDFVQ